MKTAERHTNCIVKDTPVVVSETWTDFFYELEVLLAEVIEHGGAWIGLTGSTPEDPFVQIAATTDGVLLAQASNTLFHPACGLRHLLEDLPQLQLAHLGWSPPAPYTAPGPIGEEHLLWSREIDPRYQFPHLLLCELAVRTLVEVFTITTPADLIVKTGSTPRAGGVSTS